MKEKLRENLGILREMMGEAVKKSSEPAREVTLIGVTKRHCADEIRHLLELGQMDVAENYALKGLQKAELLGELGRKVRWHLIGHLQKNKIKKALSLYSLIHSVDSISLFEELEKHGQRLGSPISILLQVNTSGEASKGGFSPTSVWEALQVYEKTKWVKITGLMTMAPFGKPENTRPFFAKLRNLRDKMAREFSEIHHLSMGMSNDFLVAIEEGATMVRVGSRLFHGISKEET